MLNAELIDVIIESDIERLVEIITNIGSISAYISRNVRKL